MFLKFEIFRRFLKFFLGYMNNLDFIVFFP